MSAPKKHHYVPVFYLKRWAGDDGQVSQFRRFSGNLKHRRLYPTATGFEIELYSIRTHENPDHRQIIETNLMSNIDNGASDALDFMENTGNPPTDIRLRSAWTGFLLSLIYRSPVGIKKLRQKIFDSCHEDLSITASKYQEIKSDDDPDTFEEYFELNSEAIKEGSLLSLLQNLFASKLVGNSIFRMKWSVININKSIHGLLTCDIPLMLSNGLGHKHSFIMLPISPRAIFMAAASRETAQAFVSQGPKKLETALNDAIVQQAQELVIAQDSNQYRFIDNRFLRKPPPDSDFALHTWESPLKTL